ncbi:hypothetical protein ACP70R_009249 [Stipagrostis hirtigluma subsp. patula]
MASRVLVACHSSPPPLPSPPPRHGVGPSAGSGHRLLDPCVGGQIHASVTQIWRDGPREAARAMWLRTMEAATAASCHAPDAPVAYGR